MPTSARHRYVERSSINSNVLNWFIQQLVAYARNATGNGTFTIKSNSKITLTCHVVLFVIRTSDQKLLFGYATSVTSVHMGDDA